LTENRDFQLKDADIITIRAVQQPYENYVMIEGEQALEYPGKYELLNDMRISDLVSKAKLLKEARTDLVFLERKSDDGTVNYEQINLDSILQNPNSDLDLRLRAEDIVRVTPQSLYVDRGTVTISGAVRKTTEFNFDFNDVMTVSDAILMSGGLLPEASEYGYIVRRDPENLEETRNIPIRVKEIMVSPDSPMDLQLRPFDEIQIFSNPTFTETYNVEIKGSVRDTGFYAFSSGMQVSDLILRAGGLQEDAYDIAYIMRTDANNSSQVSYQAVNVKEALANPNSNNNIELRPNDQLQIYANPTFTDEFFVRVQGQVRNPGQYKYDESLNLSDVLRMAGGLKKEAASNKIEIFRLLIDGNNPTKQW